MTKYNIATIPGDGIGNEVIPVGQKILEKVASLFEFEINWTNYNWSCEMYKKTGQMMPKDGIKQISNSDAIYLGAVGFPGVPDHISLWGLLIPIRREFEQYVNLRPVRLFEGVPCPLVGQKPGSIDFIVVRENCEGEYSNIGEIENKGTEEEKVTQLSVFTKKGTDRILKYAFELAKKRSKKHLTSATKSNGIMHTMPYWDSRVREIAKKYQNINVDQYHIDILTANFVLKPQIFDVVVGSNLFGDILSDLGPAVTGTIGIAPSANLNPELDFPSMFEPVHGSAPDISGRGISNPIGAIWAGAMMLQHLGEPEAYKLILSAIEKTLKHKKSLTRDMGGVSSTTELGDAILKNLG